MNTGFNLLNTVRTDLNDTVLVCQAEKKPTNYLRELMNDLAKGIMIDFMCVFGLKVLSTIVIKMRIEVMISMIMMLVMILIVIMNKLMIMFMIVMIILMIMVMMMMMMMMILMMMMTTLRMIDDGDIYVYQ